MIYLAIVVFLVGAAYWAGARRGQQNAGNHPAGETRRVLYYVDPMNPAHTADRPGKAPCGMDMEPVYADATPGFTSSSELAALPAGTIKVAPEKQQLIGVRVATVEKKGLVHNLRLLGKVATDETRVYRINATIDGWITRTMPVSAGSLVRKNETLAGFVLSRLQKIPQEGDSFEYDGRRFFVEKMEGNRIAAVKIERIATANQLA